MRQLSLDESARFPRASEVIQKDVFVDDIVSGDISEDKALALQQELIGICQAAGFTLHKWHSNSPAILAAVQPTSFHGERHDNVPFAEMENDMKTKARKPPSICFYKSIGSYQGVTLYGNAYTDAYGAFGRVPCVRNQAWVRCPPRVYNPNAHSLRLP
ncbi:unnamed protein product, partial [Iphiclides podalirius]